MFVKAYNDKREHGGINGLTQDGEEDKKDVNNPS